MKTFTIEGKTYEWDNGVLTVEEAMLLKDKTGMGLVQWNHGLAMRDGYAEAALIFFAKKRAGEAIRWQDLSGLNLATFAIHDDEPVAEGEKEGEGEAKKVRPNPTSRGGKTPRRGTSAT